MPSTTATTSTKSKTAKSHLGAATKSVCLMPTTNKKTLTTSPMCDALTMMSMMTMQGKLDVLDELIAEASLAAADTVLEEDLRHSVLRLF